MISIEEFLRGNPVAVLSLVLGLGFLVGKVKILGFEPGSITGVLFVGLAFGHLGFAPDPTVQTIGFTLFIFSVACRRDRAFFSVIKQGWPEVPRVGRDHRRHGVHPRRGRRPAARARAGGAAGLLAGGLTSSPTLAAAQEAVRTGQAPVAEGLTADQVMTNISTAYAITYIFGLAGLILIIRFLPRVLGLNLPAEAARLEASRRGGVEDRVRALREVVVRGHRLTNETFSGTRLELLYERAPGRVSFEKIRRGGEFIEVTPETQLELGDEICLVGFLDEFVARAGSIGPKFRTPNCWTCVSSLLGSSSCAPRSRSSPPTSPGSYRDEDASCRGSPVWAWTSRLMGTSRCSPATCCTSRVRPRAWRPPDS